MPSTVSQGTYMYQEILTFPVTTARRKSSQRPNNRTQSHLDTLLPEFTTHMMATVKGKTLVPTFDHIRSVLFSFSTLQVSYLLPGTDMNTTWITVDEVGGPNTIASILKTQAGKTKTRNGRNDSRTSIVRS